MQVAQFSRAALEEDAGQMQALTSPDAVRASVSHSQHSRAASHSASDAPFAPDERRPQQVPTSPPDAQDRGPPKTNGELQAKNRQGGPSVRALPPEREISA